MWSREAFSPPRDPESASHGSENVPVRVALVHPIHNIGNAAISPLSIPKFLKGAP
jgi:hypothetical protein